MKSCCLLLERNRHKRIGILRLLGKMEETRWLEDRDFASLDSTVTCLCGNEIFEYSVLQVCELDWDQTKSGLFIHLCSLLICNLRPRYSGLKRKPCSRFDSFASSTASISTRKISLAQSKIQKLWSALWISESHWSEQRKSSSRLPAFFQQKDEGERTYNSEGSMLEGVQSFITLVRNNLRSLEAKELYSTRMVKTSMKNDTEEAEQVLNQGGKEESRRRFSLERKESKSSTHLE